MKIAIYVEHLEREYLFALILKKKLERQGYRVLILNLFFDNKVASYFKPDIVFLPYFYSIEDPSISKVLNLPGVKRFYSLSWEQIFNDVQIDKKIPKIIPKNLVVLSWSSNFRKLIPKDYQHQVVQVGHPMWSLYWQIPTGEFTKESRNGNVKLYFENLTWINMENEKKLNIQFTAEQSAALNDIKDNIRRITKLLNRNSFLVKVRPSSTYKRDKTLGFLLKRTKLVRGLPAIHYISKSNYCFGDFSSTMIDSLLLGLPTYGFCIQQIPRELSFAWHSCFTETNNFNGRKVKDIWILDRQKTLDFLISGGFINEDYFKTFFQMLEQSNFEISRSRFSLKFYFAKFLLISGHIMGSVALCRRILFRLFRPKLDLRTHTQDFISIKRYLVYRLYAARIISFL